MVWKSNVFQTLVVLRLYFFPTLSTSKAAMFSCNYFILFFVDSCITDTHILVNLIVMQYCDFTGYAVKYSLQQEEV